MKRIIYFLLVIGSIFNLSDIDAAAHHRKINATNSAGESYNPSSISSAVVSDSHSSSSSSSSSSTSSSTSGSDIHPAARYYQFSRPNCNTYSTVMLFSGINLNKIDTVREALKFNADINARDEEYQTPLMRAVWKESVEIVKLLLELKEIDINAQDKNGNTALILASSKRNLGIQILLNSKNADGKIKNIHGNDFQTEGGRENIKAIHQMRLTEALQKGNTEQIIGCIVHGAVITEEDRKIYKHPSTKLFINDYFKKREEYYSKMRQEDLNNEFLNAVEKGDLSQAKNLLIGGADFYAKKENKTVLMLAVISHNLDVIKFVYKILEYMPHAEYQKIVLAFDDDLNNVMMHLAINYPFLFRTDFSFQDFKFPVILRSSKNRKGEDFKMILARSCKLILQDDLTKALDEDNIQAAFEYVALGAEISQAELEKYEKSGKEKAAAFVGEYAAAREKFKKYTKQQLDEEFLEAIKKCDLDNARATLLAGADIFAKQADKTALMLSVITQKAKNVFFIFDILKRFPNKEKLFDYYSIVDNNGNNALLIASINSSFFITMRLRKIFAEISLNFLKLKNNAGKDCEYFRRKSFFKAYMLAEKMIDTPDSFISRIRKYTQENNILLKHYQNVLKERSLTSNENSKCAWTILVNVVLAEIYKEIDSKSEPENKFEIKEKIDKLFCPNQCLFDSLRNLDFDGVKFALANGADLSSKELYNNIIDMAIIMSCVEPIEKNLEMSNNLFYEIFDYLLKQYNEYQRKNNIRFITPAIFRAISNDRFRVAECLLKNGVSPIGRCKELNSDLYSTEIIKLIENYKNEEILPLLTELIERSDVNVIVMRDHPSKFPLKQQIEAKPQVIKIVHEEFPKEEKTARQRIAAVPPKEEKPESDIDSEPKRAPITQAVGLKDVPKNRIRWTALLAALTRWHNDVPHRELTKKIIEILIKNGADIYIRDLQGKYCIDQFPEIKDFIVNTYKSYHKSMMEHVQGIVPLELDQGIRSELDEKYQAKKINIPLNPKGIIESYLLNTDIRIALLNTEEDKEEKRAARKLRLDEKEEKKTKDEEDKQESKEEKKQEEISDDEEEENEEDDLEFDEYCNFMANKAEPDYYRDEEEESSPETSESSVDVASRSQEEYYSEEEDEEGQSEEDNDEPTEPFYRKDSGISVASDAPTEQLIENENPEDDGQAQMDERET